MNPRQRIRNDANKVMSQKESFSFDNVLNEQRFKSAGNQTAEYSMWGWVYNELSNLKIEVSRLALLVRLNNPDSPQLLDVYHAHLYSLMIPTSVVLDEEIWKKIDLLWHEVQMEIQQYNLKRIGIKTLKIPQPLIEKLDKLYRITLLMMQQAGIGIPTTRALDLTRSIEDAIVGE